jgi:ferritin-like metal-binding protein YciE
MQDLQELFLDELADIYNAEKQLLKALPKMAKAANSEELRMAFEEHLEQTRSQAERLEEVFELFDSPAKGKKCEAMEGLIAEGEQMAKEFKGNSALDAGLICAAQKVEHYEIASYGCLCTWAEQLNNEEALGLLKENLSEEKDTDERLTDLAESRFNEEAASQDSEDVDSQQGRRSTNRSASRVTATKSRSTRRTASSRK